MSELSPDARSLLDAARDGDDPRVTDRVRVRRTLMATIGTGTALASSTAATASVAATAGPAKAVVATKVLGWLMAGGAAGLAVAIPISAIEPSGAPAPVETPPAVVAPRAAEARAQAAPAVPVEGDPAPAEQASEASPAPAPATTPAPSPAKPTHPARPAPAGAPATSAGLSDEVRVLNEAHVALRDGDSARALALLDDHRRRFSRGALGEERQAARVLALCDAGRVAEAKAAAERFLAASPRSPLAPRVRQSCALREK